MEHLSSAQVYYLTPREEALRPADCQLQACFLSGDSVPLARWAMLVSENCKYLLCFLPRTSHVAYL